MKKSKKGADGARGHSKSSDEASTNHETDLERHATTRRNMLKGITAGSGAVLASQALPEKWTKPIINSTMLPAHAQTSPSTLGTLLCNWVLGDDAPGGLNGISEGTTFTSSDFLYDDGTDMSLTVAVDPPQAAEVSFDFSVSGTTYGSPGGEESLPGTVTTDPDTGAASFGSYSPNNGDFGDAPGAGSISVTFHADGFDDCVITLQLA